MKPWNSKGRGLSWEPHLQHAAVLGVTRAFVSHSPRDGWPAVTPADCSVVLDGMIATCLSRGKVGPPELSSIQFSPTGPIQEIAMANGWHDEYMDLASEYDRLSSSLGLFDSD